MSDQLPGDGSSEHPSVPEGQASHFSEVPSPVGQDFREPHGFQAPSAPYEVPPMSPPVEPFGGSPTMSPPPTEFASNYPRAGLNIMGYIRPPGVYWDAIGTGFSMVTSNVGPYVLSSLLAAAMVMALYACIMPFIFAGAFAGIAASGPTHAMGPTYPLVMIVPQSILQYALLFPIFGLISVGVRHAQGFQPQVNDFFIPFKRFKITAFAALLVAAPLIVITVLSGIIQAALYANQAAVAVVSVGVLLLMLPVYLCTYSQLLLSGTASIFNGNSPIENAKLVYSRLGWQALMLGLLFIVASFAAGLGFIACLVGALFTYPIMTNTLALHYIYNFPEDQAPVPGQVNYGG